MKKRFYIGTSWKMNKLAKEGAEYLGQLKDELPALPGFQIFVVVPFTALWKAVESVQGSSILIGAQNMHWADEGPYTGEISPKMLIETGIHLVELGHSERRAYNNETDQEINKKVKAALAHGLIPLICVGESLAEKNYGISAEIHTVQLRTALHGLTSAQAERVWVAYEPVWAIGEGAAPAEPDYADAMQAQIRSVLVNMFGRASGGYIPILYGGSVSPENAPILASYPNIDGLFIGRHAWTVGSFLDMIHSVEAVLGQPGERVR
jgi:L-erythrulose 1-phosphate isomerase